MKTSEYLKKVQAHFMVEDLWGDREYFLCLVAGQHAGLDYKIIRSILDRHNLFICGGWNSEMQELFDADEIPYEDWKNLRVFVRALFLHLAIQYYQAKGD